MDFPSFGVSAKIWSFGLWFFIKMSCRNILFRANFGFLQGHCFGFGKKLYRLTTHLRGQRPEKGLHRRQPVAGPDAGRDRRVGREGDGRARGQSGGNYIKIGLPGKSILGDYFQENRTSQRPFLLLRISYPRRPIFIQFILRQLYKNRSSRKINSQRLFSRE